MDILSLKDPRVSFLILTYNQERFIEEAVRSALEIEYANIEFIISDDSSIDSTYSIIERIASEYVGKKRVTVLRSEKNLGIGGHINKLLKMASGELIFFAAGDDISYKNRVRVVVDAWIRHGRNPDAICSSVDVIDESSKKIGFIKSGNTGKNLKDELRHFFGGFIGCTEVITSRMALVFNGFDKEVIDENKVFSEDRVFPFRAFLMGGILCIDDHLVGYRVSGSSVSNNLSLTESGAYKDKLSYRKKELQRLDCVLRQYDIDLDCCCKGLSIDEKRAKHLSSLLQERRSILLWQLRAAEGSAIVRLFALVVIALNFEFGIKKFVKFLPSAVAPRKHFWRFP